MRIDVVLSPTEFATAIAESPGARCAVIDVLRATTTLVVMGERGVASAILAASVEAARLVTPQYPGAQLAGEAQARRPEGFDLGNSPAEVGTANLAGCEIIFATTNGTVALRLALESSASAVWAASLRNAGAVATLALASPDEPFIILCAGQRNRVALDDAFTAGSIVARLRILAEPIGISLECSEGAFLAETIAAAYATPMDAFRASVAGQSIHRAGLDADLAWCAEQDTTLIIPRAAMRDGVPIVTFA
jgi:2-phosphosulfolactate phosphatase